MGNMRKLIVYKHILVVTQNKMNLNKSTLGDPSINLDECHHFKVKFQSL